MQVGATILTSRQLQKVHYGADYLNMMFHILLRACS